MSDVEVKRWENSLLGIGLWVIRYKREFYFIEKEVAESLGFRKPRNAIELHLDDEDKMTLN